jgi:hypothetical protein
MTQTRAQRISDGKPRDTTSGIYKRFKIAKTLFRKTHRQSVLSFLDKEECMLDKASVLDDNEFWRFINKINSKTKYTSGFEMTFNGFTLSDPQEVNEGWTSYFSQLYSIYNDENLLS